MKNIDKQSDNSRRKFLHNTIAGGAGAALVITAPGSIAATPETVPDNHKNKNKKGYHLSKHIVDYYKSAAD